MDQFVLFRVLSGDRVKKWKIPVSSLPPVTTYYEGFFDGLRIWTIGIYPKEGTLTGRFNVSGTCECTFCLNCPETKSGSMSFEARLGSDDSTFDLITLSLYGSKQ
ncbi:MAG: hypothetical protein Satyrvirus12_11 [Satyrvirus sp.]|uniref:Uncharacterized protein n=1 Tax=Satyrvirus sp. TaxID=2487771 RepID=A0A3G5ADW1_9VIRU|nr:MAG: hypothetical protein Satyrvirus12_11 [Satyrvirus sp.]